MVYTIASKHDNYFEIKIGEYDPMVYIVLLDSDCIARLSVQLCRNTDRSRPFERNLGGVLVEDLPDLPGGVHPCESSPTAK
jgi:hypothetical protein